MEANKKFCPATWFSGFFALGALVHLVRFIFQVPVTIGATTIPMNMSIAIVVIFGLLSLGLLYVGIKKPCCKK